jgi:hypothetical protein
MEEQHCDIVSSRGLLKSCNIRSSDPSSSNSSDILHLENMIQHDDMSIYVCTHGLRAFVNRYLSTITHDFYLVSGDSDLSVPNEALDDTQFKRLVTHPRLKCWYAQNLAIREFPKVRHLPIGLDYHTIYNDPGHWWKIHYEKSLPVEQEELLQAIKQSGLPVTERTRRIFCNVHHALDRYGQRKAALDSIPQNLLDKPNQHLSRSQTWERMTKCAFVLSPYGNGYDCHRTWEALCMGAIPIIKSKNLHPLYEDLPVLNVDDWSDVTEELLERTVEKFSQCTFSYQKLKLRYWVDKFSPK